ncbi:MAG TPA: YihY/virulence factor BrkB family protein, partial [Flavobacteriales bacterium]|nr:YihY/virulence factor BrkB family protein [Flavobacteriales bacterium]
PYSLVWLLLTFIYIVMPNTKVNFGAALFAGVIAGTIFQLTEFLYVNFQIGVASYNAIYGSFAALPLFLAWLQISWLIILFGAELSFAKQNVDKYELEIDSSDVSYNHRRLLSVLITHHLVLEFDKGEESSTTQQISDDLNIPIRIVRQVLFDLQEAHIISEVHTEDPKVVSYQPAQSINKISICTVVNAIENLGGDELPVEASAELKTIKASMDAIQKSIEKSSANILLKDI